MRRWWITQTLVSYTVGRSVYRASDEKPSELDNRTSVAIFEVLEAGPVRELVARLTRQLRPYADALKDNSAVTINRANLTRVVEDAEKFLQSLGDG